MDQSVNIQSLLEVIAYITPLGVLIWKAARMSTKIEQNEKDINGLAAKHEKDEKAIKEDIDLKYTELKEAIEESKIETRQETKEILETVTEIKVSIATIATKLDTFIK